MVVLKTNNYEIFLNSLLKSIYFVEALPVVLDAIELICWEQSTQKEKIKVTIFVDFKF